MPRISLAACALTCAPLLAQEAPAPQDAPTLPHAWLSKLDIRCIGPANMSGRITDLAVCEQNPTTWWAASASGGLLKTTNDGITFEHQFDEQATVSIGDVAVAPSDPNIVWVGTGESNPRNSVSWGDGVYKSTDGGETWTNMGLSESFQIGSIVIHPDNPDIVYVGALGRLWGPSEERGLYKTVDGGKTWERILYIDDKTGVVDVNMHPLEPDTLIVTTYERQRDGFSTNDPAKKWGPGSGIWKTTDAGATWTELTEGLPTCDLGRIDVEYYRANPDIVYALVESSMIGDEPENAPYVGVEGRDADVGAHITEIAEESPAAQYGLKQGDIVVAIDGEIVQSYDDMIAKIRAHVAGDTVLFEVSREREPVEIELTFDRRPGSEEDMSDPEAWRERSPFRAWLGGQFANMQDQQGPDGYQYGGLYKSTDGGETWTRINSLNPRPMYFSQLCVDPSNDDYIYVLGISLHKSEDNGETFTDDGHEGDNGRTHVDHHAIWIDPEDGRHIILGNDGGVYVTRDRMQNWDHHNQFAIGQFYHVAVGPKRDYMVYGGLQDNGSWGGPGRVADNGGPTNEDWFRIGGGDGFICRVDPSDPQQVYAESQHAGLVRYHLGTGERSWLRPRAPRGVTYRWHWRTPYMLSHHNPNVLYIAGNYVFRSYYKGDDPQRISHEISRTDEGKATAFAESPLGPNVLYVGTDDGALWMTLDGGANWIDCFNPPPIEPEGIADTWQGTTADDAGQSSFQLAFEVDDSGAIVGAMQGRFGEGQLEDVEFNPVEGELAFELVLENATLEGTAVLEAGVLSGNLTVGEETVAFQATRVFPDEPAPEEGPRIGDLIPAPRWVSCLEASRYEPGRVYMTLDGHRSDDDAPYVFVSEDYGRTWRSILGDLPPACGTARVIREDIHNENVLYLGTEFAMFVSIDRGESWTSLSAGDGGLPTVAVHEIAQHEPSGDIIIATHGRSLWVLDGVPLRQFTPDAIAADVRLYQPRDVVYWRSTARRGGTLRAFEADDPESEASIYYSLAAVPDRLELEILDHTGAVVQRLEAPRKQGLNRVTWNLRTEPEPGRRWAPRVRPGDYYVVLTADDRTLARTLTVEPDPTAPDVLLWGEEYERRRHVLDMMGDEEETGEKIRRIE